MNKWSVFGGSLLKCALLLCGFCANPVQADWQQLRTTQAEVQGNAVLLRNGEARVVVSAVTPHVLRVRRVADGKLQPDSSFAVVQTPMSAAIANARVGETHSELRTAALSVQIQHAPFTVEIRDAQGRSLDADDPQRGTATVGDAVRVWKRLRESEQVFGFGEKNGRLNRRGVGLGGGNFVMWNTDYYGYDASADPLYISIPFYMVLHEGRAHGIFFDNTHRSSFDVGREDHQLLSFGATGGEMDYYFIDGPTPKEVIQRYTELTGRMPLPPRWALGFQQSRWSYFPEARFRAIAENFRQRNIPADVLWLDIDYLEGFTPFVWNKTHFPEPKKMLGDLREQGFRVVSIVDPHPKKEAGYRVWDEGLEGDHFIKDPDGNIFEGKVWPSNDPVRPANSVFPDFTRAKTRKWWGSLHKKLLDDGIAGIWNDMNEPAVWTGGFNTMPLNMRHENDGRPTDQREIHNVYGMLHTRATHEGLLALRPDERPFVLTRASFAGGQRYAAAWTGDNTADWSTLRESLSLLMSMGISGMNFVGTDIGGFAGHSTPELFTRWLQAAVFTPFMRAHAQQGKPEQDPWSFGAEHEALNRQAIELRYRLLPQLYTLMEEAARTGVPVMRPMFLEYPDDWRTWNLQDQFLFGSELLVAPVLSAGAKSRSVFLPKGVWFDYWTGEPIKGDREITVPVRADSIPMFVRAGSFVFQQPVVQHTGEMTGQPLLVQVFPAQQSEAHLSRASLYEDDGASRQHLQGAFMRRHFTQSRDVNSITLTVSAAEGKWSAPARSLCLVVRDAGKVSAVRFNGKTLKPAAEGSAVGWWKNEGVATACAPDGRAAQKIMLSF